MESPLAYPISHHRVLGVAIVTSPYRAVQSYCLGKPASQLKCSPPPTTHTPFQNTNYNILYLWFLILLFTYQYFMALPFSSQQHWAQIAPQLLETTLCGPSLSWPSFTLLAIPGRVLRWPVFASPLSVSDTCFHSLAQADPSTSTHTHAHPTPSPSTSPGDSCTTKMLNCHHHVPPGLL